MVVGFCCFVRMRRSFKFLFVHSMKVGGEGQSVFNDVFLRSEFHVCLICLFKKLFVLG